MRFTASLRRGWKALWSTPATTPSPWKSDSSPLRVGSVAFKKGTVLDSLSRHLVRPQGQRASLRVGLIRWKRGTPMFLLYEALLISGKLKDIPIKWGGESWWKRADQLLQKQWLPHTLLTLGMGMACTEFLISFKEYIGVDDAGKIADRVAEIIREDADELADKLADKLAEMLANKDAEKDANDKDDNGFKWSIEVSF